MQSGDFRRVMSRFAAGVTVVTMTSAEEVPVGFTATAFCSLSLDPPLALVCVIKGRYAHRVLAEVPAFAVNILAADQQHVAYRFADPRVKDRFSGVPVRIGPYGLPLLAGSIGGVILERVDAHDAGDHTIFIGRARAVWDNNRPPLLHFSGRFNRLVEPPTRPSEEEQAMSDFLVGSPW